MRHESGQVTVEYVLICIAVVLSMVLIGFGTSQALCTAKAGECGNAFVELSRRLSDSLAVLSTILSLPF